jgi:hypothetical protein
VSPEECMTIYCYETLVDAQMAAADDARLNSANHANAKERAEWAAYATTAANICAHALDGISTATFPVDVRHGDNPRRIGAYRIVRLTEGDAMDCSTCENPGIVTYIGGRGNVIACCDDCREADEKGERIRADFAAINTPPSATLPIPPLLNVGDRVRFTRNVTRYPFVIISEGDTGTVTEEADDVTAIKLDTRHVGLDEWDNTFHVVIASHDIDDTDALEVFATCTLCNATVTEYEESPDGGKWCNACNAD